MNSQRERESPKSNEIPRRQFLKLSKDMVVGIGAGGVLTNILWVKKGIAAIPVSEGYLLVDIKKCQGCLSCMLACSLVHEGDESLSLSRIQVLQNSFQKWPDDIMIEQCRQCVEPSCVEACPEGALMADPEHGNVRRVCREKCIGCMACIEACPYLPSRTVWNFEEDHAQKCDLCAEAPFWVEKGGPEGKQACVEICSLGAIRFTNEIPQQEGDEGYKVNLRGKNWRRLGYPID
ncbi:4Fe-4S dicluster domain-containing protein [Acidobacteriota bacterium]